MKRTLLMWACVLAVVVGIGCAFGLKAFGGALAAVGIMGAVGVVRDEMKSGGGSDGR